VEVLEDGFGLRCFAVLKGLAMGARLGVPTVFVADLAEECFLEGAVDEASKSGLLRIAPTSSSVFRWACAI